MKIGYLVSSLRSGGPVNQLYNIVRHLDHQPIVIELSDRATSAERQRFEAVGAEVITLDLDTVRWLLSGTAHVRSCIKTHDIDIIHSHGFRSDLISSRISALPTVSTMHNYPFHDYPIRYARLFGYLMCYVHLRQLPSIDTVVSCSTFVKEKLAEHGVSTVAVPNAVDTTAYQPPTSSEQYQARNTVGIPHDRAVFLYVGQVSDLKRTSTVLDGYELADTEQECEFHVVGDGDQYETYKKRFSSNNQIVLHGYQTDVITYLHAADFYVSASKYEGLPTAVLEALATGRPVGLSNIGPHEEIITDASEYGVLFDGTDPEAAATMFNELLAINYRSASDGARSRAVSTYDSEKMSNKYCNIYNEFK